MVRFRYRDALHAVYACIRCSRTEPMTKGSNYRTNVKGYKNACSPVNRVCGRIPRIPPESATGYGWRIQTPDTFKGRPAQCQSNHFFDSWAKCGQCSMDWTGPPSNIGYWLTTKLQHKNTSRKNAVQYTAVN